LDREALSRLDRKVRRVAVALPAGEEARAAVVRDAADLMARAVGVLVVTGGRDDPAGDVVDLSAGLAGLQGRGGVPDRLEDRVEPALHRVRRLRLARGRDEPRGQGG